MLDDVDVHLEADEEEEVEEAQVRHRLEGEQAPQREHHVSPRPHLPHQRRPQDHAGLHVGHAFVQQASTKNLEQLMEEMHALDAR